MSTHEMIPAPVPGGMSCKNCKAFAMEIAYVLGPDCPKAPASITAQAVDETERLRAENVALQSELAEYRLADQQRQRLGELEWAYTQRRLREEAEKMEAGKWSGQ